MHEGKVNSGRVEWVDCAKGFAILLVIVGHTVGGVLRGAIFSFHMPLFFILSCVTYKCSNNLEQFRMRAKRSFNHVVVPFVFLFLLRTVIQVMDHFSDFSELAYCKEFILNRLLTVLFASGVPLTIADVKIAAVGMPWFLIVLFLGRTIWDFIHIRLRENIFMFSCVVLSILGVVLGKIQWLPFSFDIVLAIMPLFLMGYRIREKDVEDNVLGKAAIYFGIWSLMFLIPYLINRDYLELACRRYTLYPACYITALMGTLALTEVSVLCLKFGRIVRPITFLGENSLYMFCVHEMDYLWKPLWEAGNSINSAIIRVFWDVLVFVIVVFIGRLFKKSRQVNG